MHNKHSDWPLKGTFFVLPMKGTEEYFYDKRNSTAKLRWLVDQGFELGNHTLNHAMGMNHFNDGRVEMEIAKGAALIDKFVPGYDVDTLALPYGVYPKNHSLVKSGQSGGLTYNNICALKAWGGPAKSPADTLFDPYDLTRTLPGDGSNHLGWFLGIMQHKNKLYPKYISDGDPLVVTVPAQEKSRVALDRLTKARPGTKDITQNRPGRRCHCRSCLELHGTARSSVLPGALQYVELLIAIMTYHPVMFSTGK